MNKDLFLRAGFSETQITKIPESFAEFIMNYYNEVELEILSTAAIVKGASILYAIYYPDDAPIDPAKILQT